MRAVIVAVPRLLLLSACLVAGLAAALLLPHLSAPRRQRLIRLWSRSLLRALGVRLRAAGEAACGPSLVVANHVSWLDVIAIAGLCPATFVCKSEIAGWPLLGWLLRRANTVFIRRASLRDVLRVNDMLRARLRDGETVMVFPEGTTTDGSGVLPFRPALFQPAVDLAVPVRPVVLRYSSDAAVYVGETSFGASLLSIAQARGLEVGVQFLCPCDEEGGGRKQLARAARSAIDAALLAGRGRQQVAKQHAPGLADRPLVEDLGAPEEAVRQT